MLVFVSCDSANAVWPCVLWMEWSRIDPLPVNLRDWPWFINRYQKYRCNNRKWQHEWKNLQLSLFVWYPSCFLQTVLAQRDLRLVAIALCHKTNSNNNTTTLYPHKYIQYDDWSLSCTCASRRSFSWSRFWTRYWRWLQCKCYTIHTKVDGASIHTCNICVWELSYLLNFFWKSLQKHHVITKTW